MATSVKYKDFIMSQLQSLGDITIKPMMGEYLLYYNGVLFGGIYDDRLLIKITEKNKKYNLKKEIPYSKSKPMYFIDNVEDIKLIKNIVLDTVGDLNRKGA